VRIRVVVYNVRGFRGGVDEVARVVTGYAPDLVLVAESGRRRSLRRFAATLGMEAVGDPRTFLRRRIKNAVLVRPPWRFVSHRLHRFGVSERFYPRGALIAQVGRSGLRVWAVAVHLGLSPAERRRHAQELTDLTLGLTGPVLLGGDFNEGPDRRAVVWTAERFWDAWLLGGDVAGETFPSSDPTARIDYLFVSEGVRVDRVLVPDGPAARTASDHRPLVAELTLGEGDSKASR
jgi:endonuclease/exonuclease/phosphatase family metal-dependent hydrolase